MCIRNLMQMFFLLYVLCVNCVYAQNYYYLSQINAGERYHDSFQNGSDGFNNGSGITHLIMVCTLSIFLFLSRKMYGE